MFGKSKLNKLEYQLENLYSLVQRLRYDLDDLSRENKSLKNRVKVLEDKTNIEYQPITVSPLTTGTTKFTSNGVPKSLSKSNAPYFHNDLTTMIIGVDLSKYDSEKSTSVDILDYDDNYKHPKHEDTTSTSNHKHYDNTPSTSTHSSHSYDSHDNHSDSSYSSHSLSDSYSSSSCDSGSSYSGSDW